MSLYELIGLCRFFHFEQNLYKAMDTLLCSVHIKTPSPLAFFGVDIVVCWWILLRHNYDSDVFLTRGVEMVSVLTKWERWTLISIYGLYVLVGNFEQFEILFLKSQLLNLDRLHYYLNRNLKYLKSGMLSFHTLIGEGFGLFIVVGLIQQTTMLC